MKSTLTKIGHNEFRVDFQTTVNDPVEKIIVVDGETYTRTIPNTYEFDSVSDFNYANEPKVAYGAHRYFDLHKGYWHREVFSLLNEINGEIYYVWNYRGFYRDRFLELPVNRSVEPVANLLFNLHHFFGLKHIKKICLDKSNGAYRLNVDDVIRNRYVRIYFYHYGYNNCVYAEVNLYYFLKYDFINNKASNMYHTLKELVNMDPKVFPQKMLIKKLSQIELNEVIITILMKSINLKK